MAGPTESVRPSPPSPLPASPTAQPASAAPDKPLTPKVTSGNLATCKPDAKTDKAIVKDLVAFHKAYDAYGRAQRIDRESRTDATGQALDGARMSWIDADDKLNEDIMTVFRACLPSSNPSKAQIEKAAAQLTANGPKDAKFGLAVSRAKEDLLKENETPEHRAARAAAGITKNITKFYDYTQLTALSDAYKNANSDIKLAIRKDPDYKSIIVAEAEKCFSGDRASEGYIPRVLENVRGVLEPQLVNSDLKRDLLDSVLETAKRFGIDFSEAEIASFNSIVFGGPGPF